jgi:hypothetical protein
MRDFIQLFEQRFIKLHEDLIKMANKTPSGKLFWQPLERDALFPINSVGEYLLRSAGRVEQTFGGLATKLWDDPFEWTLPEQLSTPELIINYLEEVESTRNRGFSLLKSDDDLRKIIPAPVRMMSLFEILLETITAAENLKGRGEAIFLLSLESERQC